MNLWPNLTGGEAIDLLGRLRGRTDRRRRDELLERFELDPTTKARTYSKGNRQKVALVAALASDVELLVLDEPTSGLDPLMESVFQHVVGEATAQGRSVLLSSHILAEVEKLCDTVTIIRHGRTVQTGTLDELRHLTRNAVRAVMTSDPSGLAVHEGVHHLVQDGDAVAFDVDNDHLDTVMRTLSGLGLRSLVTTPPSLEELFLRQYGDDLDTEDGGTRPLHPEGGP